jgi:hypothetical protein
VALWAAVARCVLRPNLGAGHLLDAEIHWPSLPANPYARQVWAVEVELGHPVPQSLAAPNNAPDVRSRLQPVRNG